MLLVKLRNILINNSTSELNKLQCIIKNDNENTIELYSNINYNSSFTNNGTIIVNSITYGNYYFTIFENQTYNLDTTTKSGITYQYGLNKVTIGTNDIIKMTQKFNITSYPSIILVKNNPIKFEYDRNNIKDFDKFLKENKSI